MTEFRYLTADQWGIAWKRPPIAEKQPDPECYVHHTAGATWEDAAAQFRAMNLSAQTDKDYSALAYDVLVHRAPTSGIVTIAEGRGKWMSAATLDRNEQGEAVCLVGYFHPGHSLSRQPHPDELEGVARGIVWGIQQGWISRDAQILGHRDNPAHPDATGCPGDYLYAKLPAIRNRVTELLAPPEEPAVPTVVYFKLYPESLTIWGTADGFTAFRLEQWQCDARGINTATVEVLPAAQHAKYQFHTNGLPSLSVK